MIKSEHLSRESLLELLSSDGDSLHTDAIGEHLHQCEQCQKELEALTAKSAMWKKAPVHLRQSSLNQSSIVEPVNVSPSRLSETLGHPLKDAPADESEWKYPIEPLLDPPKHPEMMGSIGKYGIECEVGRGGMGVVLKAHDATLNRPLAIKILAPHLASNGIARKRFAQEAIAAAGVIHPNVIAVHGVSNEGKTPYMVMPFVDGPSLQSLVEQRGPLTEIEIVRIGFQVSSGLAAAHAQGLVHRDIKPANILVELDVNRVLITDFGLARAEDDASLTRTGWLTGTPNYMSPEQTRGDRPDQRSDLFSLGSTIYFLATGRLPFRAEAPLGVLNRIQNDEPTPVRQVNNQISKTLSSVIEKLHQKQPADRFQSSAELHELLEKHLAYLHQPDVSKPPKVGLVKRGGKDATGFWRSNKSIIGKLSLVGLTVAALIYAGAALLPNSFEKSPSLRDDFGSLAVAATGSQSSDIKVIDVNGNLVGLFDGVSDESFEPATFFENANQFLEVKNYDEALINFQRAATFKEFASDSNYNIGCILAINGETERAIDALAKSVNEGFDDLCLIDSDQDLESLRGDLRFVNLVSRVQQDETAQEFLGAAVKAARKGKFAESEALCRKSLEVDPGNDDAATNLGYALHMQGKLEEAFAWHQRAADSEDFSALGNYNLACYHSLKSETDKAFLHLDLAVKAGLTNILQSQEVENDPDLDNLRKDSRYETAIEQFSEREEFFPQRANQTIRLTRGDGPMHISTGDESGSIPLVLYGAGEVVGDWEASLRDNGKAELQILRTAEGSNSTWGYMSDFKVDEFTPELSGAATRFELKRKYGTVSFDGSFEVSKGKGEFQFKGSDSFRKSLADRGITDASDALLFRFFFAWKNEEEVVANLQELQKLDLDKETLQVLMVDGVEADVVESYQEAGLDVTDHLIFVIWRVKPRSLKEYMEAGLDLKKHQDFINQRVPAQLLVDYNNAGLSLNEHKGFIAARVEPRLLQAYQAAGFDLAENDDFINRRVPPMLLAAYKDAGLELDKHDDFINARVEPKLIKSYLDKGLSVDDYSSLICQRLPAKLVLGYQQAGFDLSEFDQFLQGRVEPEFIASYVDKGLVPKKYAAFINARVPAKLIVRYQDAGLDVHEYKSEVMMRKSPEAAKKD